MMMWSLASLATNLVFNLKGELWKGEAQLESSRVKSRKPKRRSLIHIKIASKLHFAAER